MNRFKPHIALLICNIVWAMDYPFYNIVLPRYVHPMAMVSGSLIATALFSLVPLLWQKAEKVEKADVRKLIGAALLIGVLRKVFIMYGLSMTSPIDGSAWREPWPWCWRARRRRTSIRTSGAT